MPKVAGSVKELLAALDGIVRIEGDRLVVVDEDGLRTRGIYDLAWSATFSEDEATVEAARWIVWEASQAVGARSASIQDLYTARSRGEYEGMTVPAINLRAQTFDMARDHPRDGQEERLRRRHLRAGALGADIHLPARVRVRDERPRRRHRRRLEGPRLHPGRPLPVQRQEVRGRPGEDDRGDPQGLPRRHRRRLPEHRHRQLHARRPLVRRRSMSSSTRTTSVRPNSPRSSARSKSTA